jgi:hypothetical protein
MKTTSFTLAVAAIGLLAVGAFAATVPEFSSQWRIEATGSAESSGEILFRVVPEDGADAIEVPVSVRSGTEAPQVARMIRAVLRQQLAPNRFDVNLSPDGAVIVTPDAGQANFAVQMITSDVPSLSVVVSREEQALASNDSQPQPAEKQLPESSAPDR